MLRLLEYLAIGSVPTSLTCAVQPPQKRLRFEVKRQCQTFLTSFKSFSIHGRESQSLLTFAFIRFVIEVVYFTETKSKKITRHYGV